MRKPDMPGGPQPLVLRFWWSVRIFLARLSENVLANSAIGPSTDFLLVEAVRSSLFDGISEEYIRCGRVCQSIGSQLTRLASTGQEIG